MKDLALDLNPFSLIMEPELVDKPLIPYTKEALAARAAFDAAIDAEDFEDMANAYFLN
jgi:hypothetical protein